MKTLLFVLILCFFEAKFRAHATEQDDSSLFMESKSPESEKREQEAVSDDDSDIEAFLAKKQLRFTTRSPPFRFTTRRPPFRFTPTSLPFYTPKWFYSRQFTRCYRCYNSPTKSHCLSQKVSFCRGECYSGTATLRGIGRKYYFADCRTRVIGGGRGPCSRVCDEAFKRGLVSSCSIRCCFGDLCNGGGRPTQRPNTRFTTRSPPFTRRPTANNHCAMRVLWRLLRATRSILEALSFLLKSHMGKDRARGYKRKVTSMIKQVNLNAQGLEDSRDPEALQAKHDIIETRTRAQAIIRKLDEFLDQNSDEDQ